MGSPASNKKTRLTLELKKIEVHFSYMKNRFSPSKLSAVSLSSSCLLFYDLQKAIASLDDALILFEAAKMGERQQVFSSSGGNRGLA